MKFTITSNDNVVNLMRKLGYSPYKEAYVKRLTRDYFPRFHVHLREKEGILELSLHLDQKRPWYKGQKAHSAEYEDSQILEDEKERILNLLEQ